MRPGFFECELEAYDRPAGAEPAIVKLGSAETEQHSNKQK